MCRMPAKFLGYWVGIALICPALRLSPESIVFVLRLSQIHKISIQLLTLDTMRSRERKDVCDICTYVGPSWRRVPKTPLPRSCPNLRTQSCAWINSLRENQNWIRFFDQKKKNRLSARKRFSWHLGYGQRKCHGRATEIQTFKSALLRTE